MTCETKRMLWLTEGEPIPVGILPAEVDPDGCQNRTTQMFIARLCPCWVDPRKFIAAGRDFEQYTYVGGLMVNKVMLCPAHESYFRDYLNYPFVCPGCGVFFGSADEILLAEQDIEEIL